MAAVLGPLIGFAIGWAIKVYFLKPQAIHVVPAPPKPLFSEEWLRHAGAHAVAQQGSLILTAPEALLPVDP